MESSKILRVSLFVVLISLFFVSMAIAEKLEKRINFLDKVDKVDWYKVVGKKNVVIGWKGLPDNFYEWNQKAAINASKSSLYEVSVWSVRHRQKNWKPGQGGQICMTRAKYGRSDKTDCRKTKSRRR
ncbi:MAG: hypothetical protein HOK41_06990 [Nitrospina sp.]|jgi:hypothetical protein|nr:hypothetical protein [Nitrospina sp.]MBT6718579.1 hypothetical protein [Nitrospina sp.]